MRCANLWRSGKTYTWYFFFQLFVCHVNSVVTFELAWRFNNRASILRFKFNPEVHQRLRSNLALHRHCGSPALGVSLDVRHEVSFCFHIIFVSTTFNRSLLEVQVGVGPCLFQVGVGPSLGVRPLRFNLSLRFGRKVLSTLCVSRSSVCTIAIEIRR